MSKYYYLKKPDWNLLSQESFRDNINIINVLLNIIDIINTFPLNDIKVTEEDADIVIAVDKMSRCFISEGPDKIHCFTIPFMVREEDEYIHFYFEDKHINSRISAYLKVWASEYGTKLSQSFEAFFDYIEDVHQEADDVNSEKMDNYIWKLCMMLSNNESGYLRYDHDEREIENHPIDHIDFFFSNNATFKLGLRNPLNKSKLEEIVNINKKCYYICD